MEQKSSSKELEVKQFQHINVILAEIGAEVPFETPHLPGAKVQFPYKLHILNDLQSPPCVNFRVVQSELYLCCFTQERKKEKSNKINNRK